ncbi:amidohydrolase [Nocardioides marmoraquaticus]
MSHEPFAVTGARVFDGHRYRGDVGPVLVEAGRVSAVGRDVPAGWGTVEAAGALLSPGFTDAHVHVVQGGLERIRCDLSGLEGRDAYLAAVASYAAASDREWVLGGGWAMAAFPGGTPTATDLDTAVADRPVFLANRDHHGAWVNSCALELAGIHAGTPDPADGRIERDADGHPTGTLHEGAMALVTRLLPATTEQEHDAALLAGQSYLHSLGVVGWQDAIVGAYSGMDDCGPTYLRAAQRGTLTGHVVGALWWDREAGLEQLPSLLERRAAYTHGRFRATSVKIMQDGVAENFTAAMTAPYLDRCGHPTRNDGLSFVDAALLRRAVPALAAEGFQVHVHAIGDRGVREALDALELAAPGRHHVAHLQVVHPDDVRRFAAAGVAANCQALWACLDDQMVDLTLPFLGPERAGWQYPFGELHRAGTRLVMGSDWPVSTPDPLTAIHVAVNRWDHEERQEERRQPFLPEQALDLETAFAAYTSGSAWVDGREDVAGTLEPGREADLVLLDRDPFAAPVDEVGAARVAATWVGGVPVA